MLTIPADDVRVTPLSMVFGHLPIAYDDRVLRPRPWTVAQSRWAAELLHDLPGPGRVLELCAGAGHIGLLALALADAPTTRHQLVAVDANPAACELARINADTTGSGDRVEVREGRIDEVLDAGERFDVVIADPPWVPHAEIDRFPDDPALAIDGGADGLDIAWACIRACEDHLVTGGSVVLQLGSVDQSRRIGDQLRSNASILSLVEIQTFNGSGVLARLTAGIA